MKESFNVLIMIALASMLVFVSCKKDTDFGNVSVELKNEKVTTEGTTMSYYAEYSYPANLKAATILVSQNSSMSDVQTVTCDLGNMTLYASLTGLNANTTYYYKLKYDTGYGTLESSVKKFTTGSGGGGTVTIPIVTTSSVTSITQTSAVGGGNVISDGGAEVTVRGVCWSTSQNPTLSDAHNASGSGTGSYTVNMPALTANTTYYVRAYATNSIGTSYGEQKSFTTQSGGGTGDHEYVDLGLPSGLLWATCNVGAENPEDYGDYFAWGETTTKSDYDWDTYQWCNDSYNTLTKYCNNSSYGYNGFVDNKTVLELTDDAARANWGGDWRMPTEDELEELKNNCTWTLTTQNGKNGYCVTGSNGNSIFLPAPGCYLESGLYDAGSSGYYGSSSLSTDYPYIAYNLSFYSSNVYMDYNYRSDGQSVRPVCPPQN